MLRARPELSLLGRFPTGMEGKGCTQDRTVSCCPILEQNISSSSSPEASWGQASLSPNQEPLGQGGGTCCLGTIQVTVHKAAIFSIVPLL